MSGSNFRKQDRGTIQVCAHLKSWWIDGLEASYFLLFSKQFGAERPVSRAGRRIPGLNSSRGLRVDIHGALGQHPDLMREWFALAIKPSIVKRSLKYALIVGSVLIVINHSDAILSGKVSFSRLLRMLLTVVVPYTVSTLSSVGALMEQSRTSERTQQK